MCWHMTQSFAQATQVWLIEDNAAYRRSLQKVISQTPGFACARVCGSCEEAFEALASLPPPDLTLLDIGLPGLDGVSALSRLRELAPRMRIIMLTSFDDHDRIFRAICAGASGYLLKTASVVKIIEGLREVLEGGAPMSPQVARAVLQAFAAARSPASAPAGQDYSLTPREKEILELLIAGRTLKEAAATLDLSIHTVDTHVRRIYEKLHVHTRQGAVAKAVTERLVRRASVSV